MNEFGEKILQSIDMDANVMEHHGIKGQRWGVIRTPAELGYKEAKKEKRRAEKAEARKNKILNNPKLFYKHRNEFTQEEKIKALARFKTNEELYRAANQKKLDRQETRRIKNEIKDERRKEKAEERAIKEERKSRERMHALEEKTKLDLQKQRDIAQAEREAAQREYNTQQQIKKGKTITARLAKTGALLKSVITVSELGQKLLSDMGFTDKNKKTLLSDMFKNPAINEQKEKTKETKKEEAKKEEPKPKKEEPKPKKEETKKEEPKKETKQEKLEEAIDSYKKYKISQGDIDAAVHFNTNKLATIMAQQPTEPKVTYSNLMAVMSSKEQKDFIESFRKSEKMQRSIRHDDMKEIEAGETEDAE